MDAVARRARFRALHATGTFVMPNPWDVGSAKLLASSGFDALATTSAGFAWSTGRLDHGVLREELVEHVAELAAATELPLNVDSERCYPDDPGGVGETVALLADAGASGFSIEDYDPAAGAVEPVEVAAARVTRAVEAAHRLREPLVVTARAENHISAVDDFEDTLARLVAYRDAGADVVYAPGLVDLRRIERLVVEVGLPVNVLALPHGPSVQQLADAGVRRISTGGALAGVAYAALLTAARELQELGTSRYAVARVPVEALRSAFGFRGVAGRSASSFSSSVSVRIRRAPRGRCPDD